VLASQILNLVVTGIFGVGHGTRDQPGHGRSDEQFFLRFRHFGHNFIGLILLYFHFSRATPHGTAKFNQPLG
jgi:hypothetical protein